MTTEPAPSSPAPWMVEAAKEIYNEVSHWETYNTPDTLAKTLARHAPPPVAVGALVEELCRDKEWFRKTMAIAVKLTGADDANVRSSLANYDRAIAALSSTPDSNLEKNGMGLESTAPTKDLLTQTKLVDAAPPYRMTRDQFFQMNALADERDWMEYQRDAEHFPTPAKNAPGDVGELVGELASLDEAIRDNEDFTLEEGNNPITDAIAALRRLEGERDMAVSAERRGQLQMVEDAKQLAAAVGEVALARKDAEALAEAVRVYDYLRACASERPTFQNYATRNKAHLAMLEIQQRIDATRRAGHATKDL